MARFDDGHENQQPLPPAFVALYIPPGKFKPTESRAVIAARHEFCEDLAQMLTETAQTQLWSLGITEADVLERIGRGLQGGALDLTAPEADWVLGRLAELLDWRWSPPGSAGGDATA